MDDLKLYDGEYKFVNLIWENEPVNSTELVRICEEHLGWKKSTTYTVLRKLVDRGLLQNENATVISLVKRAQVQKFETDALLDKVFDGSIPTFISAFLKDKKLSEEESDEIRRMIEEATK